MAEKLFNVGIKGVIVDGDKVLLLKKKDIPNEEVWEVPGGRIDADETIEQALHRELREELPNINSIVLHQVIDANRLHRDIKDNVSLMLIFYKVTADFNGKVKLSDEHSDFRWVDLEQALKIVSPLCRRAVENALSSTT